MDKSEIKLRKLRDSDIDGMLEWMHDEEIQKSFRKPMLSYTREMVMDFIQGATYDVVQGVNIHFAIANKKDEYLGTISLKELDLESLSAEYAIVLRKKAQGKGFAKDATLQLLERGFKEYGLQRIYLNVLSDNVKAQKLYKRCGFIYEGESRKSVLINGKLCSLKWYSILEEEYREQQ